MRRPSPVNDYVASRLREIRLGKGLLSGDVARRASIPPGSYACMENGYYRVNLDSLLRVLMVLEADIDDVWPAVTIPEGQLSVPATIRRILRRYREDGEDAVSDGALPGKDERRDEMDKDRRPPGA